MKIVKLIIISALVFLTVGVNAAEKKYITENVLVLVMDGPRYSETWGDPTHQNIPYMANEMAPEGIVYTNFRNNGPTYTAAGHTAITTGIYQRIDNGGREFPKNPSMFQYYLKETGKAKKAGYIITSKDKLAVLTDTKNKNWKGKYKPYSDCGVNGLTTGYRDDGTTCANTLEILERDKPNLVLVNFRNPDSWGHAGNYEKYISSMKLTDAYIYRIYKYIQTNEHYNGKTTVFVTNDHGRHLDGHKNGFVEHGDNCEGCRKINFFAYGPDFKSGVITDIAAELIDIPVTIGELLGFYIPNSKGRILTELFK